MLFSGSAAGSGPQPGGGSRAEAGQTEVDRVQLKIHNIHVNSQQSADEIRAEYDALRKLAPRNGGAPPGGTVPVIFTDAHPDPLKQTASYSTEFHDIEIDQAQNPEDHFALGYEERVADRKVMDELKAAGVEAGRVNPGDKLIWKDMHYGYGPKGLLWHFTNIVNETTGKEVACGGVDWGTFEDCGIGPGAGQNIRELPHSAP